MKGTRRNIKVLALIGLSILLAGCTLLRSGPHYPYFYAPTNCVQVAPNFFCDETEVTNLNWLFYLDWTRRVFGRHSEIYKAALPDTNVWLRHDSCSHQMVKYYFRHPSYQQYPVVGINQEQALNYTKWREDRVFQQYLVKRGILKPSASAQWDLDDFTIERYFAGQFQGRVPDTSIKYCVRFGLPTLEQRQEVLAYSDSFNQANPKKHRSKFMREFCENNSGMITDVSPCDSIRRYGTGTVPVDLSCFGWYALHNLRGNVSEWLAEPNLSAGGGWYNSLERIKASDTFRDSLPNAWTGFRNVATWEKLK